MRELARNASHRARTIVLVAMAVAIAAMIGVPTYRSLAASPLTGGSPLDVPRGEHLDPPGEPPAAVPGGATVVRSGHRRELGEVDGIVPAGTSVDDDATPGVANLDPDLAGALRQAAADAADDGVEILIESGWRSPAYQEQLLRQAIAKYGSAKEAARWVSTPTASAHVTGDAVDIGPADAWTWLSERGADYGLCRVYRNEPWHYELRADAVDHGCPRMYADAAHASTPQR